ncbi:TPA: DivIVA domain-containing protein, partial [Clostridioides difficile]|nr:DivIVA domain-containing protein [Clostridioides difficile]
EDTCSAANKKAKIIVEEADLKARQIIEQANNRVIEIRKEYDALVKEFKIFRNKFKSLLEDEIRSVDEIFYDVDEKCVNAFEGTTVYNYSNDEAATTLE